MRTLRSTLATSTSLDLALDGRFNLINGAYVVEDTSRTAATRDSALRNLFVFFYTTYVRNPRAGLLHKIDFSNKTVMCAHNNMIRQQTV